MATPLQVRSINLLHLIGREVKLTRQASTNKGEYAGPCPLCGGGEDRLRVWPNTDKPSWWCRVCEKHGDAIDYVRYSSGVGFHDACEILQLDPMSPAAAEAVPYHPPIIEPPDQTWQTHALDWLRTCQELLWEDAGKRAFAWLHKRGFTDDTIVRAGLGYQSADAYEPRGDWGLDVRSDAKAIYLPRGIVIPWMVGGVLWKAVVRRPDGDPKYWTINASSNALYNADELESGKPAVLVEGAFDALAVQQETGVAAVASGTTGARGWVWVGKLALCEPVLVALDDDEGGNSGAAWWCDVLQAKRLRPMVNDPAAMLEHGIDLVPWLEAGLEVAA